MAFICARSHVISIHYELFSFLLRILSAAAVTPPVHWVAVQLHETNISVDMRTRNCSVDTELWSVQQAKPLIIYSPASCVI